MENLWYYPLVGWIVTINPVFLELIEKMENWGEDRIWRVRIYPTCWINCQILFGFSRISTFNERLPSCEVNNFIRYIVESPAQSLGIIRQIWLSLRRLFCWKRECSLPYKISVYQSENFGVMFHHCDVLIVKKGLHITHTLEIKVNLAFWSGLDKKESFGIRHTNSRVYILLFIFIKYPY